jgi:hypothetical protein
MRKFYAFFAAALISVSAFASRESVPTDQVLAEYYEAGQLCVCIYAPDTLRCSDYVFVGTYNGWNATASACTHFVKVDGYDGWYVVAINDDGLDEEGQPRANGIEGKPVLLDKDGVFSWGYQAAEITIERGSVQIVTEGAAKGEIDLKNYDKSAPVVFAIDALKEHNNPCSADYHNYTIAVINDGCEGWAVPYVVGDMNGWSFEEMQYDGTKTEYQYGYFYYTFRAAEGTAYQVVSGLRQNVEPYEITTKPGWNADSYMQKLVDGNWVRMPGEKDDNLLTHDQELIVFDLRQADLRWARCDDSPVEYTVVHLNAPAGAPAKVEIIGEFGEGWSVGTEMEHLDNGWWHAEVDAKAAHVFKFRTGVGETADDKWANQIVYYVAEDDDWYTFGDGHSRELKFGEFWEDSKWKGVDCKYIELDFSNADEYKWQIAGEEGIEDIVLTEKAHKVVVDGVIYIVRDNKMFNLQGAQVR